MLLTTRYDKCISRSSHTGHLVGLCNPSSVHACRSFVGYYLPAFMLGSKYTQRIDWPIRERERERERERSVPKQTKENFP
jgi:hypothetical protein